ncbi:NYN domain-containing protein [Oribacterium sp. oral taxon 078]|uniref:NYN domain-containing protein n=1 Tax=Oribacterium sp. oral taxon 078 TaxID=652706 RepID=UPI000680FB3B|nr:NYN domain-containing protein [Oribacterium sp. oral taxon 078]
MDLTSLGISSPAPVPAYKDSVYDLVSEVAYLIGVPKRIFENDFESPQLSVYERLELDKSARIIRNLCILRTSIERNFKKINDLMRMEYKGLYSIPEYIYPECLKQLGEDGVDFIKRSSTKLCHHVIEINRIISQRIHNCKNIFPVWIKWDYIKELFLMPNGLTEAGTKTAADIYYANLPFYPYQMYINWPPKDEGNILYNDKKFATLLYSWHNDRFMEGSKVSDAGAYIKNSIYDFINENENTVLVVDCENSDPYKFCAALRNLDREIIKKISRIILFDDVHTTDTWSILESYIRIPVEYLLIERIKQDKSLVDIRLTTRVCKEHWQNQVNAFVLVSSDSDYWGLISALPEAEFLVMIEHTKCGPDMKSALEERGIFYCYLDDFYTGNSEDIKRDAILREMKRWADDRFHFNINEMLDSALYQTRINLSEEERRYFTERYLKTMTLNIDEEGELSLGFKSR